MSALQVSKFLHLNFYNYDNVIEFPYVCFQNKRWTVILLSILRRDLSWEPEDLGPRSQLRLGGGLGESHLDILGLIFTTCDIKKLD